MSTTDDSGGGDVAATPEELARLQAERDQLQQEVEKLENRPERRRRTRKVVAVILVILTVFSLALAVPGAWVRRTTVNTDRYVATVGPLVRDPAVQEYLARTITAEVFTALGVQTRLATVLQDKAPQLVFLAGPITSSVQGFVQDQVQKLVASDAFAKLWESANRVAQSQIVAVLNGGGGVVSTANGKVVLNLLPIVNDALAQVSSLASDLVGRTITIPEITSDEVPAAAIQKIEAATGIQLPDNFGQIVVLDSNDLAAAQDAFSIANRAVFALVLLFVIFFVAAMWVSPRRRRTLIQIMAASAVVLVIERRLAIAEAGNIVDKAKPENQAAVQAVVNALKGSLLSYTGWLLAIALIVLVISLLTGPYGWAVRMRGFVRDVFNAAVGAARGAERTPATEWIAGHRDALLLGGAVVVLVLLLWLHVNWVGFLILALLAAGYVAIVWRIAMLHGPEETEAEPATEPVTPAKS